MRHEILFFLSFSPTLPFSHALSLPLSKPEPNAVFVAQLLLPSNIPIACSSLIFCVCRLFFSSSFALPSLLNVVVVVVFFCFVESVCRFPSPEKRVKMFIFRQYRQFNFVKTVFHRVFVVIIFILNALNIHLARFSISVKDKIPRKVV